MAVQRSGLRGGGELLRRPMVLDNVGEGTTLATIWADQAVAGWIQPGCQWWPRPRRVPAPETTARWQLTCCPDCRGYQVVLTASIPLSTGQEILVAWNPSPEWEDAVWPYEATFDGGARQVGRRQVAGAGATIWEHCLSGGPPRCIATAVVAIPWQATAQVAEAIGCRTALEMLHTLKAGRRSARVVGDNLAVVRYCAGTARLRRATMQAQLEPALAAVAQQGWQLTWQAVRRRLNGAADSLATQGVYRAADLLQEGLAEMECDIRWLPPEPSD